jgi:hypothetical protein
LGQDEKDTGTGLAFARGDGSILLQRAIYSSLVSGLESGGQNVTDG